MSLLTSWLIIQFRSYASAEKISSTQVSTLTIRAPESGRRVPDKADDSCGSGVDLLLDTSAALLASEAGKFGWAEAFAVEG